MDHPYLIERFSGAWLEHRMACSLHSIFLIYQKMFNFNASSDYVIRTKFYTWHDSTAVMPCAKWCCDQNKILHMTWQHSCDHVIRWGGLQLLHHTIPVLVAFCSRDKSGFYPISATFHYILVWILFPHANPGLWESPYQMGSQWSCNQGPEQ